MELQQRIADLAKYAEKNGYGVLSTGEQLAVALVLNRHDWLAEMDYTIAQAMDRIDADWLAAIPEAARSFNDQRNDAAFAAAEQARQDQLQELQRQAERAAVPDLQGELVTYGSAPGYRSAHFVFNLRPLGSNAAPLKVQIHVEAKDGESIAQHLREVHEWAWRRGQPLDMQPGERRPAWIG